MAVDFKTLEKLLVLAKRYKLAELEVEDGKAKFKIKRVAAPMAAMASLPAQGSTAVAPANKAEAPKAPQTKSSDDKSIKILSPFVGTFYRSPSPEADPYVSEGMTIKKGDVLCIVEAMKLMNEIESEISGRVVAILAENGQPVEYGEPLFLVEPL